MKKILLKYPDEVRDITDICAGYTESRGYVNVIYTHSKVNGKLVPYRHVVRHMNAVIEVVEE